MTKKFELKYLKGNYIDCVPNQLGRICSNPSEIAIMLALIELRNTYGSDPFCSNAYLQTVCAMGHDTVSRTVKSLQSKCYISVTRRYDNTSIYHVNMGKILTDIKSKLPTELVGCMAAKELREDQLDAIAVRRLSAKDKKRKLVKACSNQEIVAVDKNTGDYLNYRGHTVAHFESGEENEN